MKEYHVHTFRCKHAVGDVSDYAKSACKNGYEVLGISDHTPLPDNFNPEIRMSKSEIGNYINAFKEAQEKYPCLKIIKGMECEYFKEYHNFYMEELREKWGLRYLILGQHIFRSGNEWICFWKGLKGLKELKAYTNSLIEGIGSGVFDFVAHPDIFGAFYAPWDAEAMACSRAILDAARDMGLPIELNTHGFRKPKIDIAGIRRYLYPLNPFWELVSDYSIPVIVSSDAHNPEDLGAGIDEAYKIVSRYHLTLADLTYLE
ncbi:MAG TPA: histidinol-phosphatase [Desulfotomaculum sp.]|nr:histidinol-phosphatase [Desulfotomaculum sp.]